MSAQLLERLYRRIMGALAPARIRTVNDTGAVQLVQIDYGPAGASDLRDNTPALGLFGLASNPPVGSDCVVVHFGGAREKAVVIATNNQTKRLKNLAPGDSAIYDVRGAYAWFQAGGLVISATSVKIAAPAGAEINGSLDVSDNLSVGNGATGSFTAASGQLVTVKDGIVVNISP